MLRSILSVLLLLIPVLALAVPVPPDREMKLLEKHWGTPLDPDGDCGFRAEQGSLFIKIPGKPHILSAEIGKTNGPRVLREVEGDFAAVVRVSGPFPVDPKSLVEGRWACCAAGLLVWHDEKNYIRFERAHMHFPNGQWRCWPNWELRQDAKATRGWEFNDGTLDEAKGVTLRAVRKGATFTASFRPDGGAWQELPPIHTQFGKKVQVGVAAGQNTAAGYEATFDDLGITSPPAPP